MECKDKRLVAAKKAILLQARGEIPSTWLPVQKALSFLTRRREEREQSVSTDCVCALNGGFFLRGFAPSRENESTHVRLWE
jgi:hypothetical protein